MSSMKSSLQIEESGWGFSAHTQPTLNMTSAWFAVFRINFLTLPTWGKVLVYPLLSPKRIFVKSRLDGLDAYCLTLPTSGQLISCGVHDDMNQNHAGIICTMMFYTLQMPTIEQQQLVPVGAHPQIMGMPAAPAGGGVPPGVISLSTLIDYIIQRTYHDLQVLSEL